MKKAKSIAIAALVVVTLLLAKSMSNKVDARELALFSVYVQPLDAKSGAPVNISVGFPDSKFKEYLRTGSSIGSLPGSIEMQENGPYRITWIDFKDSRPELVLKCEGYKDSVVETALIEKFDGSVFSNGIHEPKIIRLNKVEQVGRGDAG